MAKAVSTPNERRLRRYNEELKTTSKQTTIKVQQLQRVDNNKVQVLYFNYKTYMNEVYKVKETGSGAEKVIEKDDTLILLKIKKEFW